MRSCKGYPRKEEILKSVGRSEFVFVGNRNLQ